MRLVSSLAPLLLLGFAPVAQPPPATCRPQLLVLPNSYPATEASGWPTESWLGWRHFERPETLEPVHLAMGERRQGVGEDDEVDVTAIPDADFAVRCIPEVQAGRIFSAGVVNKSLAHEGPLTVAVAATRYRLRLESKRKDLFDARVLVSGGGRTQVIYSADGFADDPHFEIAWAGDLDGDERLDLVVNLSNKYSILPYRLLLSSKAAAGALVGEAAAVTFSD